MIDKVVGYTNPPYECISNGVSDRNGLRCGGSYIIKTGITGADTKDKEVVGNKLWHMICL